MNLIKIKNTVKNILTVFPETRDNDNLLTLKVWKAQDPNTELKNFQFWSFAAKFKEGKYASTESIRRVRQKLQELNPHLRGDKYKERHEEQQSVKKQLQEIT